MNAHSVRVVVVDDSKDSADTMAELLRMNGYEVWISSDGREALAHAASSSRADPRLRQSDD